MYLFIQYTTLNIIGTGNHFNFDMYIECKISNQECLETWTKDEATRGWKILHNEKLRNLNS